MKRLLSIVTFLVLLVMLFQMNTEISFADTTYPVVYVGGVALNDGEYLESGSSSASLLLPSDNYVHYKDGTLSLYNYSYEGAGYKANVFGYYAGIYTNGKLTVNLVGVNNIGISSSGYSIGIYTTDDLTVSGNGKITVNADNIGLLSDNSIILDSGDVVVESEYAISVTNNVKVAGASVDAKSNATEDDSSYWAIYCVNGTLELSSNVTITASEHHDETSGEYDVSKLSAYDRIIIKLELPELLFVDSSSFDIGMNKVGTAIPSFSVASGVSGGVAPYTFGKVSGPDWITVANDGTVSGTPTADGDNAPLVIRVTDNAGQSKDISINVEKTEPDTYIVSFDANGATSSMEAVNASGEYTLPENGFTAPTGMQFKCWSINNVEMNVGDTIIVSTGITLKAIWEAIPIPDIWVGGVGMFDGDYLVNGASVTTKVQPLSDGYAYYNDGILTLCGYTYTGKGYYFTGVSNGYAIIYSTVDLTVICVDNTNNTLIAQGESACNGIVSTSDIIICGNGMLNIIAEYNTIYVDGDIEINDIALTVSGGQSIEADNISITTNKAISIASTGSYGINAQGDVNIDASELVITTYLHSVHSAGKVDISGEDITLTATSGAGIYALNDDTTIAAEDITITGMSCLACDNVTINGSKVEFESTLNYGNAILAYNNLNIQAEDITIISNGTGILSYENITVECDNLKINCLYGTALYSLDKTVRVIAENIDISADACIDAEEVIITATNDIKLFAKVFYGILSDSEVQITAKSFLMVGVYSDVAMDYKFNNQYDENYEVFIGNAVDELQHIDIISPKSSYIGKADTNVLKIIASEHTLSDWMHDGAHHWKSCSCGLIYEKDIHVGGTATCKDLAVCDECGAPYDEFADHEYGELIPSVDEKHTTTELVPSVDAHYYCEICEKYFTVNQEETNLENLTGEIPTHVFGDWEYDEYCHWKDCACGATAEDGEHVDTDGDGICDSCRYGTNTEEPELGENDYLYYILFVISIIGIAATYPAKKRKQIN